MPVTEWLDAYTSVLGDNRLDEEPAYIGKEQSGMAGYTEQAYLQGVGENSARNSGAITSAGEPAAMQRSSCRK
jgi:hypothetical protein